MTEFLSHIRLAQQLLKNMGWGYCVFRLKHEFLRHSGLLRRKYPTALPEVAAPDLSAFRGISRPRFFFSGRENVAVKPVTSRLKEQAGRILNGEVPLFSASWYKPQDPHDWGTNPSTGYHYDIRCHWTRIESLSAAAGDIKYVWERARFSHLLTVMRYDAATGEDHSGFVFDEIVDFIEHNPLNQGPNYVCSQEISIRVMNWLFLLNFYKFSSNLTEDKFHLIIRSICGQLQHVYRNIDFSCIAVRNNHAITESAMLYIAGLLFPEFPEASRWKKTGMSRLVREIEFQIYPDGTHLQYSTNYHRVVLQVMTYVGAVAEINREKMPPVFWSRLKESIEFLFRCQNLTTGRLPNYGANDGALFFPLNDEDFRDYRPQLDAAFFLLTGRDLYENTFEDRQWFGRSGDASERDFQIRVKDGFFSFPDGGIFIIRDAGSITMLKCASYHHNRPSHADDLHLDIFMKDQNVLCDGGSYSYNTGESDIEYFSGSESHNTVMLDSYSQMQRGSRFIWYHWVSDAKFEIHESDEAWIMKGQITAFGHLGKGIRHTRVVRKSKGQMRWEIEDTISNLPRGMTMRQLWHTPNGAEIKISSDGRPSTRECFLSDYYGMKTSAQLIEIRSGEPRIKTLITGDDI